MEWFCGLEVDIDNFVGFVYIIKNKINGMYYIGQKKFWRNITLPPLKGKRFKRHIKKESDWKTYYGSSADLIADIKLYGKDSFSRNILRLCKSKSEMNYYETKLQFENDVILDPKSYNKIINCRINRNMCSKFMKNRNISEK